jgi:hypothetical protein
VFDASGVAPKHIASAATAAGARTCLYLQDPGLVFLAVPHRGAQAAELRVFKPKP